MHGQYCPCIFVSLNYKLYKFEDNYFAAELAFTGGDAFVIKGCVRRAVLAAATSLKNFTTKGGTLEG